MDNAQLRWQPIIILLTLSVIWGLNMASIKIAARELPPLFMAGLRSLVSSGCLLLWIKAKKMTLFPSATILWHGVVVGLMFGSEFGLIYTGLEYTLASRLYILLYTSPFFVAIGAHFFLKGDRLNPWKMSGLILAFGGVVVLFTRGMGSLTLETLPGDLMALGAGAFWGATTVYVKRYLTDRTVPLQTLFYQVFFSMPYLFLLSLSLEKPSVGVLVTLSGAAAVSLFYQCIIVAFLSFLVWFELIHRHPVSLLHVFSFFTPVFGVFLSGVLILGEIISIKLMVALLLVSLGTVFVNRRPGRYAASRE